MHQPVDPEPEEDVLAALIHSTVAPHPYWGDLRDSDGICVTCRHLACSLLETGRVIVYPGVSA